MSVPYSGMSVPRGQTPGTLDGVTSCLLGNHLSWVQLVSGCSKTIFGLRGVTEHA
jgi:hypothetical protein